MGAATAPASRANPLHAPIPATSATNATTRASNIICFKYTRTGGALRGFVPLLQLAERGEALERPPRQVAGRFAAGIEGRQQLGRPVVVDREKGEQELGIRHRRVRHAR